MEKNLKRRDLLQWGLVGTVGSLFMASGASALQCVSTPVQPEGPFYPGEDKFTPTNDLTRVPGSSSPALGEVVYIKGVVQDGLCRPVVGVNVEIWQACASGRYNNEIDPNPAPLDPNFRYWGETFTNENGEYIFKTIVPGAYPADEVWERPPHIHFRVSKRGYQELITQSYWKGHPLNDEDRILQRVPNSMRESVLVDFQPTPGEITTKTGVFNITIEKI
jgi:protocatechuate 3,4-dioxygenase beta subunit